MKNTNSVQVSVSIPKNLLSIIESNRKGLSRSDYIRKTLEKSENYCLDKNGNGVVYTPKNLAEYVSHKVLSYYFSQTKNQEIHTETSKILRVIDPACGDGELLLAVSNAEFPLNINKTKQLNLYGIDIDKKALSQAQRRLNNQRKFTPINTNGLCPYQLTNTKGWNKLKSRIKVNDGFDIAIANPPWGANVSNYKELLQQSNLSLFSGQFDTSDLFIESTLKNVRDGGFIAFIIPDSLFYQERENLRTLLLSQTRIYFIGRFGEKIFKDVNRACAVIICEKNKDVINHKIDCFRLSMEQRNLIFSGETSFSRAEAKLSHKVEQIRFQKNRNSLFNIDIDSKLEATYDKIFKHSDCIKKYLTNSRGVELSKKGNVIKCNECNLWSPYPSKNTFTCLHCKRPVKTLNCTKEIIVHKQKRINSQPLIVGEHIGRYRLKSDLWIQVSKKGINYKNNSIYKNTKLLIRKTGIGISASIDYSGSMTNQVVYIFKLKEAVQNKLPLELFLALINSRLAFFLIVMSNGEIEWKSHPYITQRQILEFPIPNLDKLSCSILSRINSLTSELSSQLTNSEPISNLLDAKLERLVADLFGITKKDYRSIYKAIDKSQELLSVKALKNIQIEDIFNSEVA